jgi:hypothetical protein
LVQCVEGATFCPLIAYDAITLNQINQFKNRVIDTRNWQMDAASCVARWNMDFHQEQTAPSVYMSGPLQLTTAPSFAPASARQHCSAVSTAKYGEIQGKRGVITLRVAKIDSN